MAKKAVKTKSTKTSTRKPRKTQAQKYKEMLETLLNKALNDNTYNKVCSEGQQLLKDAAKSIGKPDLFNSTKLYVDVCSTVMFPDILEETDHLQASITITLTDPTTGKKVEYTLNQDIDGVEIYA